MKWLNEPFEFWPNVTHVFPFHFFLFCALLKRGMGLREGLKANWGLRHGGMSFTSKYEIQERIGHEHFPGTLFLSATMNQAEISRNISQFTTTHEFPVIIKPDEGMTGRGMMTIRSTDDISEAAKLVVGFPYMAQAYVAGDCEFGVFWYRLNGKSGISGINRKHFPTVIGDGKQTVEELARQHDRYTQKWESFLKERTDLDTLLAVGEERVLSRIGSHTMGCRFTDETHLVNEAIRDRIDRLFVEFPGFNYGRLDVKSLSLESFQEGDFDIIEVNGVESQATHMFDPKYRFGDAIRIVKEHAGILAGIAHEHRKQRIEKISYFELSSESVRNVREIQEQQRKVEELA